jgi:hypothetical protein
VTTNQRDVEPEREREKAATNPLQAVRFGSERAHLRARPCIAWNEEHWLPFLPARGIVRLFIHLFIYLFITLFNFD